MTWDNSTFVLSSSRRVDGFAHEHRWKPRLSTCQTVGAYSDPGRTYPYPTVHAWLRTGRGDTRHAVRKPSHRRRHGRRAHGSRLFGRRNVRRGAVDFARPRRKHYRPDATATGGVQQLCRESRWPRNRRRFGMGRSRRGVPDTRHLGQRRRYGQRERHQQRPRDRHRVGFTCVADRKQGGCRWYSRGSLISLSAGFCRRVLV